MLHFLVHGTMAHNISCYDGTNIVQCHHSNIIIIILVCSCMCMLMSCGENTAINKMVTHLQSLDFLVVVYAREHL